MTPPLATEKKGREKKKIMKINSKENPAPS